MNETIRTAIFVGVAAVAAIAAFASRPNLEREKVGELVDRPLFPEFKDPLAAKSLEITQFDEATARKKAFTVAQQPSGQWVIPSHGNYPADAEEQLRAAAESVLDVKPLDVLTELTTEHSMYGVLSPDEAEVGSEGVGTLVAIQDKDGDDLFRLIIGKAVADQPELRFVRKPSEEVVYVAKIDPSKLPTDFDKWIEKDLLKISTFDVARVTLKDYVLVPTQSGQMGYLPRMDAALAYDNGKGEWSVDKMTVYTRQGTKEGGLSEQEELNKQKLDDLRNALGDLKIVNVTRKPGELGNSLSVSSEQLSADEQEALREFGFIPIPTQDGKLDIYASNGEVHIDTKDGVQYVLRFGDIAPQVDFASSNSDDPAADPQADEDAVKVHRYLFVSTRLSSTTLTPPELTPEPAGPADPAPADDQPADESKDEAKSADAKTDDAKADEEKADAAADPAKAERERIRKENERKLNEYNDKKKKAEQRVAELNARFGNWYYVVSEDVYKKIRLVRSDFVKESATAKDEGFGVDAFRKLEGDGLKSEAKP